MDRSNNYYALLGVEPQAEASAIKAAFKKQALRYHPDVYSGADAEERMREILQAYQTLSDPQARQAYDARLLGEKAGVRVGTASGSSSGGDRTGKANAGARAQDRFAFPDLRDTPTSALVIVLEGLAYQLSSSQAESLKWDGMLRGEASTADAGALYHCQRCHQSWSARGGSQPVACPHCHARDWADYLLLRCVHCQAVFTSREVHDPLRGNILYHPYELFPLCPQCRRSQWCPAENERVRKLRASAARRAALVWSGIGLLAVLALVLVLFFLMH